MHPANQHAPRDPCQITVQLVITCFVGVVLIFPIGKRVARRSDRGKTMCRCMPRNCAPQIAQVVAGLPNGFTNACADLNLTLQELWAEFARKFIATGRYQIVWRMRQSKGFFVNEQVFLFDTYREGGRRCCHFMPPELSQL